MIAKIHNLGALRVFYDLIMRFSLCISDKIYKPQ